MRSNTSMRDIDALISKRLSSSWGRMSSSKKRMFRGALHRLITDLSNCSVDGAAARLDIDRQWHQIKIRSLEHPEEVTELDRRGRSCLSAACANDPPASVVEIMVDACRFGIECSPDKTGHTALHIAINSHASMEVVQALLKSRRMLHVADHRGNTALHLAASCRYRGGPILSLVRALLQVDPHVAIRDNAQGRTALHVALEQSADMEILQLLVQVSPESVVKHSCGVTPLVVALQCNAPLPVHQLLVHANQNATQIKDEFGRYPLRFALEHRCNDPDVLRLLCSSPETVLEVDSLGRTPLHMMLDRSNLCPEICDVLLDVAPQAACYPTRYSELPIHTCYRRYALAVTAWEYRPLALAAGRDVTAWWHVLKRVLQSSTQEETLLHAALCTKAPLQVVIKLLEHDRGQVNRRNRKGQTPLVVACRYDHHEEKSALVQWLLDAGGDADGALSWGAVTAGLDCRVVYNLVCACPTALTSTSHRGLYPCLLAAMAKNSSIVLNDNSSNDDERQNAEHLSVIFTLILAAPDLMKQALLSRIS